MYVWSQNYYNSEYMCIAREYLSINLKGIKVQNINKGNYLLAIISKNTNKKPDYEKQQYMVRYEIKI